VDIGQAIGSLLDGLMEFLKANTADPTVYLGILFLYSILTAIILPFPVELGLFLAPQVPFVLKALVLGLGKMVGSGLVFYIGLGVGDQIRKWSDRWAWFRWFVGACERIVARFHYVGLYFLLSIPLMSDTIPLYIFSVFNEKGVFKLRWFMLVNLLAGITRAGILLLLLELFGIDLLGTTG
jgi:membrane protein YqaA with SNARE-associated domain